MTTSKGVSLAARKRFRLTSDDLWGYAFIGVSMLVFCIFTLYPVISAVETSFLKYRPFGSQYIKWQNYAETFKNALFYKATKNTLVYTAVVVPLSLLLAFSIAIMILPFPRKVQSVFKSIYYLPASPRASRCRWYGCGFTIPPPRGCSTRCFLSCTCPRKTGFPPAKPPCCR